MPATSNSVLSAGFVSSGAALAPLVLPATSTRMRIAPPCPAGQGGDRAVDHPRGSDPRRLPARGWRGGGEGAAGPCVAHAVMSKMRDGDRPAEWRAAGAPAQAWGRRREVAARRKFAIGRLSAGRYSLIREPATAARISPRRPAPPTPPFAAASHGLARRRRRRYRRVCLDSWATLSSSSSSFASALARLGLRRLAAVVPARRAVRHPPILIHASPGAAAIVA